MANSLSHVTKRLSHDNVSVGKIHPLGTLKGDVVSTVPRHLFDTINFMPSGIPTEFNRRIGGKNVLTINKILRSLKDNKIELPSSDSVFLQHELFELDNVPCGQVRHEFLTTSCFLNILCPQNGELLFRRSNFSSIHLSPSMFSKDLDNRNHNIQILARYLSDNQFDTMPLDSDIPYSRTMSIFHLHRYLSKYNTIYSQKWAHIVNISDIISCVKYKQELGSDISGVLLMKFIHNSIKMFTTIFSPSGVLESHYVTPIRNKPVPCRDTREIQVIRSVVSGPIKKLLLPKHDVLFWSEQSYENLGAYKVAEVPFMYLIVFNNEAEQGQINIKYVIDTASASEVHMKVKNKLFFTSDYTPQRATMLLSRSNESMYSSFTHEQYISIGDDRFDFTVAICLIGRIDGTCYESDFAEEMCFNREFNCYCINCYYLSLIHI